MSLYIASITHRAGAALVKNNFAGVSRRSHHKYLGANVYRKSNGSSA